MARRRLSTLLSTLLTLAKSLQAWYVACQVQFIPCSIEAFFCSPVHHVLQPCFTQDLLENRHSNVLSYGNAAIVQTSPIELYTYFPESPIEAMQQYHGFPGGQQDPMASQVDREIIDASTEGNAVEGQVDVASPNISSSIPGTEKPSRRERNRLTAFRCRKKSKQNEEGMIQKEFELSMQHDTLTSDLAALQGEVFDLKCEILKHASCHFNAIDQYIARAANDIAAKEAPSPYGPN